MVLEDDRVNFISEMSFNEVFANFFKKILFKVLRLSVNHGNPSYKLSSFVGGYLVIIIHQFCSCSYRILFKLNIQLSHKYNMCIITENLDNTATIKNLVPLVA